MTEDLFANLEIAPNEVKQLLDGKEKLLFVDVREPWEHQLCCIEGSRLIPLGQIAASVPVFEEATSSYFSATAGVAASTPQSGCVRKEFPARVPWPAGSTAGRGKSTLACRVTERRMEIAKLRIKFWHKPA